LNSCLFWTVTWCDWSKDGVVDVWVGVSIPLTTLQSQAAP
jgi:hypothetical protein